MAISDEVNADIEHSAENSGGRGGGDVAELRAQVVQLHQVCAETREELLAHRQVLEQWIGIREEVMDMLAHREAILGGSQLLGGIGDRFAELELSLAGVSDNTARHGKAISSLAEGRKRTSAAIDAVVRAVKRLDRGQALARTPRDCSHRIDAEAAQPPMSAASASTHSGGEWGVDAQDDRRSWAGDQRVSGEHGGGLSGEHGRAVRGRLLLGQEGGGGLGGSAPLAWDCPSWQDDHASGGHRAEHNVPMHASGSSSCGSDRRSWRRSGANGGPGRRHYPWNTTRANDYYGDQGHTEDLEEQFPPTHLQNGAPTGHGGVSYMSPPEGIAPPEGSADMDSCVKGVMARIEEALTKLDGGGPLGNCHVDERSGDRRGRSKHSEWKSGSHEDPVRTDPPRRHSGPVGATKSGWSGRSGTTTPRTGHSSGGPMGARGPPHEW